MNLARLFAVVLSIAGMACAQQSDPGSKPSVFLENKAKPPKPSNSRTILGVVKDASDNPARSAIVQLKNTRTSKVVDFATKDDGKYAFRELYLDVEYELLAKRGDIVTPLKKVSPYDSRKEVTINFKLEPVAKQP